MTEEMAGNDNQQAPATTETTKAAPAGEQVAALAPRHEVEPTVQYAIVPGPGRDTFLFYHMQASSKDINGLWDYCRFCISNLIWVNDHLIVTPNPCYLNPSTELEQRFAKIKRVLLNWYSAKRLVLSLDWPADQGGAVAN